MKRKMEKHQPGIYGSKDFKELQSKWYNKLKNDGFNDIEDGYEYSSYIKNHSLSISHNPDIAEHFRRATIHAHHKRFKNKEDGFIFRLYAKGHTYRDIRKRFSNKYEERSLYWIFKQIERLKLGLSECKCWENSEEIDMDELDVAIGLQNREH